MTKKKKKRGPNKAVRMRRLLKKCSEAWSLAVRTRDGRCVRCGNREGLAAHHWIVPKHRSSRYRFDVRNGVALDYGCHIHIVHKDASLSVMLELLDKQTHMTPDEATAMARSVREESSKDWTEEELVGVLAKLNLDIARYSALREAGDDVVAKEDAEFIHQVTGNHQ